MSRLGGAPRPVHWRSFYPPPPSRQGKKVVIPLCGGNVDTPVLGRVIERG
jgi:hypothetical protein